MKTIPVSAHLLRWRGWQVLKQNATSVKIAKQNATLSPLK